MKNSLYLILISLVMNFHSFGQNKKETITYDSAVNKTLLANCFRADTVTINDNWIKTNTIKKFHSVSPHFLGLKNTNKDFIEIGIRRKKEDQFYVTNITDAELLSKDAAFETHRYKVNKNLFEKIHNNDSCYVFNEKRNGLKAVTLVGIKNDYITEIVLYPAIEDQTKNLDYLLTLFENLNIK
ncbi:hypothetical protein FLJC2902T_08220 [Flavobacterium limnosediminis JC2902]|uniref:Uncharacterized protein n=1 Tax=Flavobacterium limnosediminis JC2902 TaxID=1341181 RepID=V6SYC4_9FLAO|nr:hypothetical protein [Flavobacterium limnosediminis]ESU29420.1 hypothetical protein FLJC2902T_08220 [Flavobacterium limnosediminis JC2902]